MKDYNVLARFLAEKYIRRVSGRDFSERIVGDSPEKVVMAGTMAEERVETTFEGEYREDLSKQFESIPSISLSFHIDKNSKGNLYVIPRGLLFYNVRPEYEEVKEYIIKLQSERDHIIYSSVDELKTKYPNAYFSLPQVYKKVVIEDVIQNGIKISVKDVQMGKTHLEELISDYLNSIADTIASEICIVPDADIYFSDLVDKDHFDLKCSVKEGKINAHWALDILQSVSESDGDYFFTFQMVNKTPKADRQNIGYLPKIYDAGLTVVADKDIHFKEIPMRYFKTGFKKKEPVYAIAENASVEYIEEDNKLITINVPRYYQYRTITIDKYSSYTKFDALINDPVNNLKHILNEMKKDYKNCQDEFEKTEGLTPIVKEKYKEALSDYENEISRFEDGIQQIEYTDWVKKAFALMNKTFMTKLDSNTHPIEGWRLFQLVFIVSMICEIIRGEFKDDSDPALTKADNDIANLLYFPTGGGKTEAFLGITVFSMFFDRIRGKEDGVTAILKYPLRLLAVQQLERVLTIVMKANIVKSNDAFLKNSNPFSLGFYVGASNTPNRIDPKEQLSSRGNKNSNRQLILESDQDTLNEYYRFIDTCPVCGKKKINVKFNQEGWRLEHICDNQECNIHALPLYIVDNEIYRYLPSVIVSTIDKMAMVGTTEEFKMLFGQVKNKCRIHGYTSGSKCLCSKAGCKNPMDTVSSLKDPIPTLFIQDELHLVKESLGTFDSHYESFLKYYAEKLVPEQQRKKIRYVGATATISMYEEHLNNLYHMHGRRFPCEYPSTQNNRNFYSKIDDNDITRIILGYVPYGRSITDSVWQSVLAMRVIVYDMMVHSDEYYKIIKNEPYNYQGTQEELKEMLYDYWIELVYNKVKNDVNNLYNAFQNQANNYLEDKGIPKYYPESMTSDTDFQSVRKTLFEIQDNRKNLESKNLLLATSTISHGVDEDSFNVMYFFGIPNNNAEYIQAYSRTGRKYTGIVLDLIRLTRVRDRSYLKNFVIFHQNKDDLVEPVPINRWAKNAIYCTLPGLLVAVLYQYYAPKLKLTNVYYASTWKKVFEEGNIDFKEVTQYLVEAYGCNDGEKMSEAYREAITDEVLNICNGIMTYTPGPDEFLSVGIGRYSHGNRMPMTSLRDTEESVQIRID